MLFHRIIVVLLLHKTMVIPAEVEELQEHVPHERSVRIKLLRSSFLSDQQFFVQLTVKNRSVSPHPLFAIHSSCDSAQQSVLPSLLFSLTENCELPAARLCRPKSEKQQSIDNTLFWSPRPKLKHSSPYLLIERLEFVSAGHFFVALNYLGGKLSHPDPRYDSPAGTITSVFSKIPKVVYTEHSVLEHEHAWTCVTAATRRRRLSHPATQDERSKGERRLASCSANGDTEFTRLRRKSRDEGVKDKKNHERTEKRREKKKKKRVLCQSSDAQVKRRVTIVYLRPHTRISVGRWNHRLVVDRSRPAEEFIVNYARIGWALSSSFRLSSAVLIASRGSVGTS